MNNRAAAVFTIMGALALALVTSAPAQTLSIYDDFQDDPAEIHPFKWRGQESQYNATFAVRNTEVTRKLKNGQLQTSLRSFGSADTNVGVTGTGRNRVIVNHPALMDGDPALTAVQVTITPKKALNVDCPANTSEGNSRATVFGFFFNDGTANATTGDLVGDIVAGVNLERNSKQGSRIVAFVSRCDQAPCATALALKFVEFTRPDWKINTPETVTIRWLKATKEFEFTVSSTLGNQTKVLTYGDILPFDNELPKIGVFFPMGVQNTVLNCAAGRREGFFDALFDNFKLNSDAVTATGP